MSNEYLEIPAVVHAVQWTGKNWNEMKRFVQDSRILTARVQGQNSRDNKPGEDEPINIARGAKPPLWLRPGDWLVKRGKQFEACSKEEFKTTYRPMKGKDDAGHDVAGHGAQGAGHEAGVGHAGESQGLPLPAGDGALDDGEGEGGDQAD